VCCDIFEECVLIGGGPRGQCLSLRRDLGGPDASPATDAEVDAGLYLDVAADAPTDLSPLDAQGASDATLESETVVDTTP
jgi:hypothetical protein